MTQGPKIKHNRTTVMRSLKAAAIVAFLALTSGTSYATKQVLSEAYRSIDHLVEKAGFVLPVVCPLQPPALNKGPTT